MEVPGGVRREHWVVTVGIWGLSLGLADVSGGRYAGRAGVS